MQIGGDAHQGGVQLCFHKGRVVHLGREKEGLYLLGKHAHEVLVDVVEVVVVESLVRD